MRRLTLLFALAGAMACSESTSPMRQVRVSVADTSIAATIVHAGSVDWLQFTLSVTVDNRSAVVVAFNPCMSSIEGSDGMSWSLVWSPICAFTGVGDPQVAPGEMREFDFSVNAAVAGPGGPKWNSPRVDGTYRYQAGVVALDGTALAVTPSNAFVVRIAQ